MKRLYVLLRYKIDIQFLIMFVHLLHGTYLYCQVLLFIWFRKANCSFQKFDDDEDEDDGNAPPLLPVSSTSIVFSSKILCEHKMINC